MNPALLGLLKQLPPYNQPFPRKKEWLAALEAILKLDYPESHPPPPMSLEEALDALPNSDELRERLSSNGTGDR